MTSFRKVPPPTSMRINNNALWMNAHCTDVWNEIYKPAERYDIVVFCKAMDGRCQDEARRIQGYGGRVVFDANVNYYEIWGDYEIAGTRPTEQQQADAVAMTSLADHVVADSTYLLEIVRRVNKRTTWIPDNVDVRLYRPGRTRRSSPPLRLVWSGVAKKAQQLRGVIEPLRWLEDVELVLVSDGVPDVMAELEAVAACRFVRWSERRYARVLRDCDVIISPKRLENGYELGHTEYKITLGMAAGLPAVASPQQSYVEAIEYAGGGLVCETGAQWHDALESLRDADRRRELGLRARRTVVERYSVAVSARAYHGLLCSLA